MSDRTAQPLSLDQFAARFEHAAPALWCVAAGVLGSREGAEDAVQDAALLAMARLATFRVDSDFVAWMATIVRFTALNQMRRGRRAPRLFEPDMPDPVAPVASAPLVTEAGAILPDQTELDDRVLRGVESLPETQRTCLLLRTVLELPYREIGRMLDLPEGTAMSHVHRARQQLVEQLRDTHLRSADARKAR